MDRMAKQTKQPDLLREVFTALGDDPFVIAECLARPALAGRLLTSWYSHDERIHGELKQRVEADLLAHPAVERVKQQSRTFDQTVAVGVDYTLPAISDPSGGCIGDTWTPTNLTGAPDAEFLTRQCGLAAK